jgi:uncharacterized membrane protein
VTSCPFTAPTSDAYALNDSGIAVGMSNSGSYHAARWDSTGQGVDLNGLPSASWAVANGIDSHGMVVGSSDGCNSGVCGGTSGFKWFPTGVMVGLPHISPVGRDTALHVNANGVIAGTAEQANGSVHVVLWGSGWQADLGTLSGHESPAAISSDGWVTGSAGWSRAGGVPFLYSPTCKSLYTLSNLLDSSGAGWVILGSDGMNDSHWIVGTGQYKGGTYHAIMLVPNSNPLCYPA